MEGVLHRSGSKNRPFQAAVLVAALIAMLVPLKPHRAEADTFRRFTDFSCCGGWVSSVYDGTYAYLFLGIGGSSGAQIQTRAILRFDPKAVQYNVMKALNTDYLYGMSAVWSGTKAYMFGGARGGYGVGIGYYDTIGWFDPASDTSGKTAAKLPAVRAFTSAIWDGTYAYIFGGRGSTECERGKQCPTNYDQIIRYNPANDEVTVMAGRLPSPRWGTSAVWDGTHAYIFGGHIASGVTNEIVRYDPATDTVTPNFAKLPYQVAETSAVWTGEEAIIYAGMDDRDYWPYTIGTNVYFSPSTGKVAYVTPMPYRAGTTALWDGQLAWVLGGYYLRDPCPLICLGGYYSGPVTYFIQETWRHHLAPSKPVTDIQSVLPGPDPGDITLSWKALTPPLDRYLIHRFVPNVEGWRVIDQLPGDTPDYGGRISYVDSTCPFSKTCIYRIQGENRFGAGPASEKLQFVGWGPSEL